MIKFYTDLSHYSGKQDRSSLAHFLKPYVDNDVKSAVELKEQFGDFYLHYEQTDQLEDADFAYLPMSMEYYLLNGKKSQMQEFIYKAKEAGTPVVTQMNGDFGVKPLFKDVIILCQNGYQSKRFPHQYAFPSIFTDPLKKYYGRDEIVIRDKGEKPVVGFDGLGRVSNAKIAIDFIRTSLHNLKSHLGLTPFVTNTLYPSVLLRMHCLEYITKDNRLIANFNIRKKYKAGAVNPTDGDKKTREFYENMMTSDYVLCVRGLGNFSKRLYETLAMGRIPVFVNTDCILPFDNIIDWKKYCVWVEKDEITHIGDILTRFHDSLSDEQFKQLQKDCRALWEKHLSGNGAMMGLQSLIK